MLARIPLAVNLALRFTFFCFAVVAVAASAGCASVAAYQRERLADPTMNPSHGQSDALAHVRAVQEGALGGELGAASGCGCN
ncbi:MAG: DUF4266 domain-containing protein [Polyangiaceae bacterium]